LATLGDTKTDETANNSHNGDGGFVWSGSDVVAPGVGDNNAGGKRDKYVGV